MERYAGREYVSRRGGYWLSRTRNAGGKAGTNEIILTINLTETLRRPGGRMAVLTSKRRNKLPKKVFGLPGEMKYPMPDKAHAANAKARAKQMLNAGKLSASAYARIVAMANRMLAK